MWRGVSFEISWFSSCFAQCIFLHLKVVTGSPKCHVDRLWLVNNNNNSNNNNDYFDWLTWSASN